MISFIYLASLFVMGNVEHLLIPGIGANSKILFSRALAVAKRRREDGANTQVLLFTARILYLLGQLIKNSRDPIHM